MKSSSPDIYESHDSGPHYEISSLPGIYKPSTMLVILKKVLPHSYDAKKSPRARVGPIYRLANIFGQYRYRY